MYEKTFKKKQANEFDKNARTSFRSDPLYPCELAATCAAKEVKFPPSTDSSFSKSATMLARPASDGRPISNDLTKQL